MIFECAAPVFAGPVKSAWVRPAPSSDVFARKERNSTSMHFSARQRSIADFELPGGNHIVWISDQGDRSLPAWLTPVLESLADRWGVEPCWDGYDSRPTDPVLAASLLNCLQSVMPNDARAPLITPLADGGVQAEWHAGARALEIAVQSGEPIGFYFYDPENNHEEEGRFDGSVEIIQNLVGGFK